MSCCEGTTANTCLQEIKYCDHLSERWVWLRAPARWHDAIDLRFKSIKLEALDPAGSLTRPDVLENWTQRLRQRKSIPPLVVCATPAGRFYVIDGNHRLEAIRRIIGDSSADTLIRVAEIVPKPGYHFRYRWMKTYGTYMLEPVDLVLGKPAEQPLANTRQPSCSLVLEQVRYEVEPSPPQLLGRTLVVLAHPDDETACAALLQRARNPVVLFCTDGAPAPRYFWGRYGSRDHYAAVRRNEAERALAIINVHDYKFLTHGDSDRCFSDQELYRDLLEAFQSLQDAAKTFHIDVIVAPAYEGGHPDHDTCGFLAHLLGRKFGVPVWETPLYYRSQTGELVHQQFMLSNGTEVVLPLTAQERAKRAQMLSAYASQPDAGDFVKASFEQYRPQPAYDFAKPPHAGLLNYEVWQWAMTGEEVCASYRNCLAHLAAQLQTAKQMNVQDSPSLDSTLARQAAEYVAAKLGDCETGTAPSKSVRSSNNPALLDLQGA